MARRSVELGAQLSPLAQRLFGGLANFLPDRALVPAPKTVGDFHMIADTIKSVPLLSQVKVSSCRTLLNFNDPTDYDGAVHHLRKLIFIVRLGGLSLWARFDAVLGVWASLLDGTRTCVVNQDGCWRWLYAFCCSPCGHCPVSQSRRRCAKECSS